MSFSKKFIVGLILVVVLAGLYYTVSFLSFLYSRPSGVAKEVIVDIPKGLPFRKISHLLMDKGLLTDVDRFVLLARLRNSMKAVKAGELRFRTNMNPLQVLDTLLNGVPVTYPVTVPEGYNMYQIAALLFDKGLVSSAPVFLKEATDQAFLKSLGIAGKSVEGYLYPDTYNFSKKTPVKELIKAMYKKYKDVVTPDIIKKAAASKMSEHELVTLASIIEKETGVPEERPMISSVFHNRLRINMRLQTDPTTIYGLMPSFNGNLTKDDLRHFTPYNTYVIYGLPPGPIASPGKDAIMAALNPVKSSYIFFVSRNNGTHYFSERYSDHQRAVTKYQVNHNVVE
jgi:UPF0755 protein